MTTEINIYEDSENIPEVEYIEIILLKYPFCFLLIS